MAIFSLSSLASEASGSRQITATCRFQPSKMFFCVNGALALRQHKLECFGKGFLLESNKGYHYTFLSLAGRNGANVMKLFMVVIYEILYQAKVFVRGKPSQAGVLKHVSLCGPLVSCEENKVL
jgi:hypothetical protein